MRGGWDLLGKKIRTGVWGKCEDWDWEPVREMEWNWESVSGRLNTEIGRGAGGRGESAMGNQ